MLNKNDLYVNPRVSKTALNKFLSRFSSGHDELHTFEAFYAGGLMIRLAPSPYSPTDKREIYSLSKSFCSTAIGFLVDEGKLSVEDRIVDIFPEHVPENPQPYLMNMRLKHVMSMNSGHPSCVMDRMIRSEDEIRTFMEAPIQFEPGTHFAYNTGATLMLSHIVEKISGMKLLDFLTWKLFMPLEISTVRWNRTPDGANEGGCGIHVCADDIAKLGLLYLNKGMWNGKRILSEEWVNEATHPISDNSSNGSPDWCSGYGYQFWVNSRAGFRGDGAFGQLCFVLPEYDMVFAVQTELGDMQSEIDALMELVYHMFDDDECHTVVLPDYAPEKCGALRVSGLENTYYKLDENVLGWNGVYFTYDGNNTSLVFSDGVDQYAIEAGYEEWVESTVISKKLKPKLVDLMSTPDKERCRVASCVVAEENKLTFTLRYLNCPHRMTITAEKTENGIKLNLHGRGLLDSAAEILRGTAL